MFLRHLLSHIGTKMLVWDKEDHFPSDMSLFTISSARIFLYFCLCHLFDMLFLQAQIYKFPKNSYRTRKATE